MNLSMGGRIMLINIVLNAIPIYSLSVYTYPVKVLKEIRRFQSNFLWHGNENKRTIHWVRWESIWCSVRIGGLSIKTSKYSTNLF